MVTRPATLLLAALLAAVLLAAGAGAWKWGGNHRSHPSAGWTWDETTAAWIDGE